MSVNAGVLADMLTAKSSQKFDYRFWAEYLHSLGRDDKNSIQALLLAPASNLDSPQLLQHRMNWKCIA